MKKEMLLLIFIILGLILLIVYFFKNNYNDISNKTYIMSPVSNKSYLVEEMEDKYDAANILGEVELRIKKLVDYFEQNIDKYPEYKPYLQQFLSRIDKINLQENSVYNKHTSYTINKGDKVVLCLRSKKNIKLHDINLIMYVVLHELAHIACPEVDHTKLFTKIFIFFIEIGIMLNIYQYREYDIDPHEYCGISINENLLKD